MRDFTTMPSAAPAGGTFLSPQDIPVNLITLHPGGAALSHATPTGGPAETGAYEYTSPVKSVRAGRLHKAGKP